MEREVSVPERREPAEVVRRRRSDDTGGAPDRDRLVREHHSGRDECPFTQEDPVAEAGTGHQRRSVADLAQVAHGRPDDGAAVPEDGASPDRRRHRRRADDDGVLEHDAARPDLDVPAGGADDGALREHRAVAHPGRAEHDCRAGDVHVRHAA